MPSEVVTNSARCALLLEIIRHLPKERLGRNVTGPGSINFLDRRASFGASTSTRTKAQDDALLVDDDAYIPVPAT